MRDILAALLRDRGYTHNEDDSDDYWYGPTLGVRPLMVCVQWELDRERARCSSCGMPTNSLGCTPDLSGKPTHTHSGGVSARV